MANRSYLGELELIILLAVIHLGEDAYGVPISRVYAALERLEAKGLVASSIGDSTPERGGKAKKYFRITDLGLRQVDETRRILTKLWQTIPNLGLELQEREI